MNIFELFNLSRDIEIKDGNVYLMKHAISIMSPNMLSDIQQKLITEIGLEEASKKLYGTAKKGFYKLMDESTKHKNLKDKLETINFINKVLTSTGWGKFSVEQFNPQKKIVVKIENSFMAKEYGTSSYACDFMLAGFLAGGLSGVLKSNFDAIETKCIASGNKFCEIEVCES